MKNRDQALRVWLSPESVLFLRYALPNSVTILALFFGLTGVLFAANDRIAAAIACVLAAALLDACDGRLARATGGASKFGAELDSLSDVVCFGAVPAFILYRWGLSAYGSFGWIVCLSLAGSAALRLARFNVMGENPAKSPSWADHFFVGVPAPAGAFLAMLPIYAVNTGSLDRTTAAALALGMVPAVAGLMVSTWPSYSGKAARPNGSKLSLIFALLTGCFLALGLLFSPWMTLTVCAVVYIWALPLSKWHFELHGSASNEETGSRIAIK